MRGPCWRLWCCAHFSLWVVLLSLVTSGVSGFAQTSTTTSLAITASGGTVTSVPAGTVVTLTASVSSANAGTVYFCDTSIQASCNGLGRFAAVQVTAGGTATLKTRLKMGAHSIKAIFAGTNTLTASVSAPSSLTVTGSVGGSTLTVAGAASGADAFNLTATLDSSSNVVPTANVEFQDTSYSNAVIATAPFSVVRSAPVFGSPIMLNTSETATGGTFAGDFNDDGLPDLISPGNLTFVRFLRGNGNGTFQQPAPHAVDSYPYFTLAVADFNGDGKLDVALRSTQPISPDPGNIAIFLGRGDGTFDSATFSDSAPSPLDRYLFAGDFNGDGYLDLFSNASAKLYLGNGDGTFQTGSPLSTPTVVLAAGDFNNDGKEDLFTQTQVLLGQANGTFTSGPSIDFTAINGNLQAVAGDFNGDGKLDVAGSNWTGYGSGAFPPTSYDASFFIALGNGDGTFQSPTSGVVTIDKQQITGSGGPDVFSITPDALVAGDFNGDGSLDFSLVCHVYPTRNDALYFSPNLLVINIGGNPDGTLGTGSTLYRAVTDFSTSPFYASTADFDNGGRDFLAASGGAGGLNLRLFSSNAGFHFTATAMNVSVPQMGSHVIRAVYPGDSSYAPLTSSNTTTITGHPSAVLVSGGASAHELPYGTATLKAVVRPTGTWPESITGTLVYFYDGSTLLGSAALTDSGYEASATLSSPGLSVGSHTIKVKYIYANYGSPVTFNSDPFDLQIDKADPNIDWAEPAPITYGTSLSPTQLNAVTGTAGSFSYTPPAGTVLHAGVHTLSTVFTPTDTTSYNPASAATTLTVNQATPAVSVIHVGTAAIGAPTSFTVTVTSAAGTPTGSVSLLNGGTLVGTGTLSAGSASFTTTFTGAGSYNLSAVYGGDTDFAGASGALVVMVAKTTPTLTWPAPAPITYNAALSSTQLNATANVAGTFAYTPAVGTILAPGSHTLSATFTPTDTNAYNAATTTTTITVNQAPAAIGLVQVSPSTTTVGVNTNVTLRATASSAAGVPTGTVVFSDGGTTLGTAALSAGSASITVSFTTTGTHAVTAIYSGDSNFSAATSAVLNETVVASGLSIVANPSTLTIRLGESGTSTLTFSPSGNYQGTANLACSGLPQNVTCSFSPARLTFAGDNTQQTSTLTVRSTSTSAFLNQSTNVRWAALAGLPLLGLLFLRRRSVPVRLFLALLSCVSIASMTGCGSNSSSQSTSQTSQTGTYTAAVNAIVSGGTGIGQTVNLTIVITK